MWEKQDLYDFLEIHWKFIHRDDFSKKDNLRCMYCESIIYSDGCSQSEYCCQELKESVEKQKEIELASIEKDKEVEKAEKQYQFAMSMKDSDIEGWEKGASFKSFHPRDRETELNKQICRKFTEEGCEKTNLILAGSVGAGKTHLAIATAKHIAYHQRKTFRILRCSSATYTKTAEEYNQDVLIIDDIGREAGSDARVKAKLALVSEVIEARTRKRMKTIYTTNLTVVELTAKYGSHIVDRMLENSEIGKRLDIESYRSKQ